MNRDQSHSSLGNFQDHLEPIYCNDHRAKPERSRRVTFFNDSLDSINASDPGQFCAVKEANGASGECQISSSPCSTRQRSNSQKKYKTKSGRFSILPFQYTKITRPSGQSSRSRTRSKPSIKKASQVSIRRRKASGSRPIISENFQQSSYRIPCKITKPGQDLESVTNFVLSSQQTQFPAESSRNFKWAFKPRATNMNSTVGLLPERNLLRKDKPRKPLAHLKKRPSSGNLILENQDMSEKSRHSSFSNRIMMKHDPSARRTLTELPSQFHSRRSRSQIRSALSSFEPTSSNEQFKNYWAERNPGRATLDSGSNHESRLRAIQRSRQKFNGHIESMKSLEQIKVDALAQDCRKLQVKVSRSQRQFEKQQKRKLELTSVHLGRWRERLYDKFCQQTLEQAGSLNNPQGKPPQVPALRYLKNTRSIDHPRGHHPSKSLGSSMSCLKNDQGWFLLKKEIQPASGLPTEEKNSTFSHLPSMFPNPCHLTITRGPRALPLKKQQEVLKIYV